MAKQQNKLRPATSMMKAKAKKLQIFSLQYPEIVLTGQCNNNLEKLLKQYRIKTTHYYQSNLFTQIEFNNIDEIQEFLFCANEISFEVDQLETQLQIHIEKQDQKIKFQRLLQIICKKYNVFYIIYCYDDTFFINIPSTKDNLLVFRRIKLFYPEIQSFIDEENKLKEFMSSKSLYQSRPKSSLY